MTQLWSSERRIGQALGQQLGKAPSAQYFHKIITKYPLILTGLLFLHNKMYSFLIVNTDLFPFGSIWPPFVSDCHLNIKKETHDT